MPCKIENCNYNYSHTTIGHKCENCEMFGHSYKECGNFQEIVSLRRYIRDTLPEPLQCTVHGCICRWSHSSEAHSPQRINILPDSYNIPPRTVNIPNSYGVPPRTSDRNSRSNTLNTLNRSNTSNNTSNRSKSYSVKCPICNTGNYLFQSQATIYGVYQECMFCDSNIEVYLPNCGHSIMCWNCLETLEKNQKIQETSEPDYNVSIPEGIPINVFYHAQTRLSGSEGKVYIEIRSAWGDFYAKRDDIGETMDLLKIEIGTDSSNFIEGYQGI